MRCVVTLFRLPFVSVWDALFFYFDPHEFSHCSVDSPHSHYHFWLPRCIAHTWLSRGWRSSFGLPWSLLFKNEVTPSFQKQVCRIHQWVVNRNQVRIIKESVLSLQLKQLPKFELPDALRQALFYLPVRPCFSVDHQERRTHTPRRNTRHLTYMY